MPIVSCKVVKKKASDEVTLLLETKWTAEEKKLDPSPITLDRYAFEDILDDVLIELYCAPGVTNYYNSEVKLPGKATFILTADEYNNGYDDLDDEDDFGDNELQHTLSKEQATKAAQAIADKVLAIMNKRLTRKKERGDDTFELIVTPKEQVEPGQVNLPFRPVEDVIYPNNPKSTVQEVKKVVKEKTKAHLSKTGKKLTAGAIAAMKLAKPKVNGKELSEVQKEALDDIARNASMIEID